MDLIRETEAYIRRYQMIEQGGIVAAGVSGGADSVCLLLILDALRARLGFHLAVVHVNHNLRGQAADEDEAYVRALCRERGIPLYVYSYPVREIAEAAGKGLEETGRLLRHRAFCSALDAFAASLNASVGARSGSRVALAHHANDLAETVLFQEVRGSSLSGLAGIRPVSLIERGWEIESSGNPQECGGNQQESSGIPQECGGILQENLHGGSGEIFCGTPQHIQHIQRTQRQRMTVIRPLLFAGRKDLEAWLEAQGVAWRTDETNADEDYARNGLRNRVIPYLETHVNEAAVRHIRDLAEDAAQADAYLHAEATKREEKLLERHRNQHSGLSSDTSGEISAISTCSAGSMLIRDALVLEPEVLQRYILMDALAAVAGRRKDLGREQLRQLQALFSLPAGKQVCLPYGVRAVRVCGGVELRRRDENAERKCPEGPAEMHLRASVGNEQVPESVPVTGAGIFSFGGWKFTCTVVSRTPGAMQKIPPNRYTKRFDYDKIGNSIEFRHRRAGDRIVVAAGGQTKKLKDYFINEKVPRDVRDHIPLLASGPHVFWVVGGRISEDGKISEETVRILEITAERLERSWKEEDAKQDE